MFKIRKVNVEGFWGNKKIETNFFADINIFIGGNGTGKTTFINLLNSVLTLDIYGLEAIEFSEIKIELYHQRKVKNIQVTRKINEPENTEVHYKIGTKTFEFPLYQKDYDYRRRRIHPRHMEIISACKEELRSILGINFISVHREKMIENFDEITLGGNSKTSRPPIDIKIEELMHKLTQYQLNLESQTNALSKTFQHQVLSSLLIIEKFDKLEISTITENSKDIEKGLHHAYKDLGIYNDSIKEMILNHSKNIQEAISNLNNKGAKKNASAINLNDILTLVLFKRTETIIQLSNELEKNKEKVFSNINAYLKILKRFIQDKEFKISEGIKINKHEKNIFVEDLSSGEKQLFVLLTETLLQKNQEYIFIADEPELSLHISWQNQLLGAVKEINKKTQMIVATHSPEIAANWENYIIKMEDIVNE